MKFSLVTVASYEDISKYEKLIPDKYNLKYEVFEGYCEEYARIAYVDINDIKLLIELKDIIKHDIIITNTWFDSEGQEHDELSIKIHDGYMY